LLPALVIAEPSSLHYESLLNGKSPDFLAICRHVENSIEEIAIVPDAGGQRAASN
jgi:hypothetical protein